MLDGATFPKASIPASRGFERHRSKRQGSEQDSCLPQFLYARIGNRGICAVNYVESTAPGWRNGIRGGLKILWPLPAVPVQVRPRAPMKHWLFSLLAFPSLTDCAQFFREFARTDRLKRKSFGRSGLPEMLDFSLYTRGCLCQNPPPSWGKEFCPKWLLDAREPRAGRQSPQNSRFRLARKQSLSRSPAGCAG